MNLFKFFLNVIFFILAINYQAAATDIIKKFNIEGNQRISDNTIILFSGVNIGQEINDEDLNLILKDLYTTNYFDDVRILLKNDILNIFVKEYPIIQKINY